MRRFAPWILFMLAACGNEARSSAPEKAASTSPAKGASLDRYTNDDPAFTVDLDGKFGSPKPGGYLYQGGGVDFAPVEPGGFLEIHWDAARVNHDAVKDLAKELDLRRNDPAPKGPIVAEGKLAGGVGVWIDIEHRVGYKEHTILAILPVGKRMVWCNAQGPAEVAAVCKSLRP